jgi:tetratricopeptide (TPR) repeat protein
VESERDRWLQERWAAEHDLVDAQLSIGLGDELVAPLSARVGQHPLDERVAGQYMLALHRAGRSADALNHYRQLRERLIGELGTDPGTATQQLHQQILTADPTLNSTPAATTPQPVVIPRQLPAAPAPFVGRPDELDTLDTTLPPHRLSTEGVPDEFTLQQAVSGRMMLISAIGGTGGIGKTWLALHWAHRNLHRYPDGHLFADLNGFSPTDQPKHPIDVLGGFLDALGVDRDRQPTDPERRAELYRSLVADKQILIVLDNAATVDQLTPLLPGGHYCTVVITSRNQLRGLVARHGVRPINLNVLTGAEVHTLLTTARDTDCALTDRIATDAQAMTELIELCGGFPLALGLIAARIAAEPHLPLADIAAELRALGVDALDSEEPNASLPTVLSWSLRHLTNQQRKMFALLGIAPGPDTGLPAAAALAGLPEREAHRVLRVLVDASLINRVPGGRYAMHDLVRAYAVTIASNSPNDLSTQARETALRRVLDFYTHTAHTADQLVYPHRDAAPFKPLTHDIHPHPLPDASAALTWFDTEHACLLAAQHAAATHHWHHTVWRLAWSLHTFHRRRGYLHDELTVWQTATHAAPHLADPTIHLLAHRYLGTAHAELGHHEDAINHLHRALNLAEHHHNLAQQARSHQAVGWAWELAGDDRKALACARRALHLFRSLDQPIWEADALNAVGWYAARLGDYDTARDHCHEALALHRRHHHRQGEGTTLDSLGYIEHHTGHHSQAITHYHRALTLFRELGDAYYTASVLDNLGHSCIALSQHEQARTAWQEALQRYEEQGRHDDAARVQHHLDNQLSQDAKTAT